MLLDYYLLSNIWAIKRMNYKNTILILGRSELVGNISSSLLYFNELYPIIAIQPYIYYIC